MSQVILLLGSNLGDKQQHLRNGIASLAARVSISDVSRIYNSAPFGGPAQPWFLNIAVRGATRLEPIELLRFVKAIEKAEGRNDDEVRWGPRPLDIDIILMGGLVFRSPELTIPHQSMAERRFCLVPVSEIAPDLAVPPDGPTVRELLERCQDPLEVFPI